MTDLKLYHYTDKGQLIYASIVARNKEQAEKIAKNSLEYNYRTNKIIQDKSKNAFIDYDLPKKEGIFILW